MPIRILTLFRSLRSGVVITCLVSAACGRGGFPLRPGICGDGALGPGEDCDDGNHRDGDGCSAVCTTEEGHRCHGTPSACECDAPFASGADCATCTVFVSARAFSVGDGSRWSRAFPDLQAGMDAASARTVTSGSVCRVWVAAGTYRPRAASAADGFVARSGVAVIGGFAGTELFRDDSDPVRHETILNGMTPTRVVLHVVTAADDTELEGLTITGGNASGTAFPDDSGGGLLANEVTGLVLTRVAFRANRAVYGAGLALREAAGVKVRDSSFVDNQARAAGGADVGWGAGEISFERCRFENNRAVPDGAGEAYAGAMLTSPDVTLSACTFIGNDADGDGGAIFVEGNTLTVIDSTFVANATQNLWGSAIATHGGALDIRGSRFFANRSAGSGTIAVEMPDAHLWLRDSVLSGNHVDKDCSALLITDASMTVERVIIVGNDAAGWGAGACVGTGQGTITSSLLVGNTAHSSAALNVDRGTLDLVGVTVADNVSTDPGAAVMTIGSGGRLTVENGILWNNGPTTVLVDGASGASSAGFDRTLLPAGTAGCIGLNGSSCTYLAGNLNADPQFAAPPAPTGGTWSAVTHDAARGVTVLTDAAAAWPEHALIGRFVRLDEAGATWLRLPVADNAATTLELAWDASEGVAAGATYRLYDYRLAPGSPARRAGIAVVGTTTDVEGAPRNNPPDLGAYESP